eukprot:TRINITY_DN75858_c0_g1_i1.p1 TRINITY_DN75858_c0_g1~~TRINITY_DN75858_c0_g1_i1.p1  ORF type:complete len:115 (-),score=13.51 TRINITY_DN75858_c0_g1_i1:20-328(-)
MFMEKDAEKQKELLEIQKQENEIKQQDVSNIIRQHFWDKDQILEIMRLEDTTDKDEATIEKMNSLYDRMRKEQEERNEMLMNMWFKNKQMKSFKNHLKKGWN